MNNKERFLTALNLEKPDRLPVTTHHLMKSYLDKYLDGADTQQFFDHFGLDPILWTDHIKPLENQRVITLEDRNAALTTEKWNISCRELSDPVYKTYLYTITTPGGILSTTVQQNEHTSWIVEHLIKNKNDIDIIMNYAPFYGADINSINKDAGKFGTRGLVRGNIPCFDIFGQPGCWQDLACLFGIENLIMESFDDPQWVHTILGFLRDRKLHYIKTLKGARFDLIELGGGDASTTVISPDIFRQFVAPYDRELISEAKNVDQKIVYHTCGGMMPILEDIRDMGPTAIETLTPRGMGGDVDLGEVKRRVGDDVCLIGGFDQGHFFMNSTVLETKKAVRDAFESAGEGGGLILSPSDHFFDASPELLRAFADEAKSCVY